jgi:hypothetical protein
MISVALLSTFFVAITQPPCQFSVNNIALFKDEHRSSALRRELYNMIQKPHCEHPTLQ